MSQWTREMEKRSERVKKMMKTNLRLALNIQFDSMVYGVWVWINLFILHFSFFFSTMKCCDGGNTSPASIYSLKIVIHINTVEYQQSYKCLTFLDCALHKRKKKKTEKYEIINQTRTDVIVANGNCKRNRDILYFDDEENPNNIFHVQMGKVHQGGRNWEHG